MAKSPVVKADSSVIDSFYITNEGPGLVITFHSGKTYSYPEASMDDYKGLKEAESAGSYFSKHIRSQKSVLI
jgi:ribosomal protein L35AE/L33A